MTSVLEKLVAIIAPHDCIGCSNKGYILCNTCVYEQLLQEESWCAFCAAPTNDWVVCQKCRKYSALNHIWIAARYSGAIGETIRRYKFERAQAAHKPLACCIDMALPYLAPDWLVVPVPTALKRIRRRGYDQSYLLAREFARKRGLVLLRALRRKSAARQLGASRQQRQEQAKGMFYGVGHGFEGRKILLVDDVCTTGATLSAAAHLLKEAGADQVNAAVVAWQAPGK